MEDVGIHEAKQFGKPYWLNWFIHLFCPFYSFWISDSEIDISHYGNQWFYRIWVKLEIVCTIIKWFSRDMLFKNKRCFEDCGIRYSGTLWAPTVLPRLSDNVVYRGLLVFTLSLGWVLSGRWVSSALCSSTPNLRQSATDDWLAKVRVR